MASIPRHTVPNLPHVQGLAEEGFREELPEYLAMARKYAYSLPSFHNQAIQAAASEEVIHPGSLRVGAGLALAAEAVDCQFWTASGRSQGLVFAGHEYSVTDRPDESMLHAGYWLSGVFLALMCRNSESLRRLALTPIRIMKESSTKDPAFRYRLVQAIQAWIAGRDNTMDLVVEAMAGTDPKFYHPGAKDYILNLDVYTIHVLSLVIDRDAKALEAALVQALEHHKKYWSQKDRDFDCDGFLSIPLLGLAAAAWEAGMRFDIDSDYLPMRFVTGEFLSTMPPIEDLA